MFIFINLNFDYLHYNQIKRKNENNKFNFPSKFNRKIYYALDNFEIKYRF
jgi:hypothetical protein